MDIKTVSGFLKAGGIDVTNYHVFNVRVVLVNGNKFSPKAEAHNGDTQF